MEKITRLLDNHLIIRYLISGGLSSGIDICIFSLFIEIFDVHYIPAAAVSVTVSFFARFYLQKKFAFRDRNVDVHRQVMMYALLYGLSMAMTTALLYIFIDIFQIWYVLAQVMTIGIIAIVSFFVYRHMIFKQHRVVQEGSLTEQS